MRNGTSVGAGSLLPSAANVNDKKQKSSGTPARPGTPATTTPPPRPPGPLPGFTRVPPPLPPPPRLLLPDRPDTGHRGAVRVPEGAPAFLPPAGQEVAFHMNPDALPDAGEPAADERADVFTLELVRPARADGGAAIKHHCIFEPDPANPTPDQVQAVLTRGQPYRVSVNGRLVLEREGSGWEGLRRAVVTIRATATPAMLQMLCVVEPARWPEVGSYLMLCIGNGQLHEIRLDDRVVMAQPATGGEH